MSWNRFIFKGAKAYAAFYSPTERGDITQILLLVIYGSHLMKG